MDLNGQGKMCDQFRFGSGQVGKMLRASTNNHLEGRERGSIGLTYDQQMKFVNFKNNFRDFLVTQ